MKQSFNPITENNYPPFRKGELYKPKLSTDKPSIILCVLRVLCGEYSIF